MTLLLKAALRETRTQGDITQLRGASRIPAVVYGHGAKNRSIVFDYKDFEKLYAEAGTSSLIDLSVDGEKAPFKVLISEIQRDPVSHRFTHVDLHQVKMDEKLRASITLNFIGESPAVKSLGGNLIIAQDSVSVECLPKDLVHAIDVDISKLTQLDDSMHISDLQVPQGVSILDDPEASVVSVLAPRAEKVVEEVIEEVAAVPGAEGEKKEGEEGALEGAKDAGESSDKERKGTK